MHAHVSAVCVSIFTAVSLGLLPQKSTATKSLEEVIDAKTFVNKMVPGKIYVNSVREDAMTAKITAAKRYRNKQVSFWLESLPPLDPKRSMILDVKKSDKTREYAVVLSETTSARHTDYSFDAEAGVLQLIKDCMNEDSAKCPS